MDGIYLGDVMDKINNIVERLDAIEMKNNNSPLVGSGRKCHYCQQEIEFKLPNIAVTN